MSASAARFWRQAISKAGFGYSFFVCHASEDAGYAESVRTALERKRLLTFLDERNLYGFGEGQTRERLFRAVRRSGVLLVVDTPFAREKPFPADEINYALGARIEIVRIQARGNHHRWQHLDEEAASAVENATRYYESPENIAHAMPNADVIDKVAMHLNWRRYWPWAHRGMLSVASAAIIWTLIAAYVNHFTAALQVVPLPATSAEAAARLFGRLTPLFEFVSPQAMSDARTGLLAAIVKQSRFTSNPTGPPPECPGQEDRNDRTSVINLDDRLKAFDSQAVHWRVNAAHTYVLIATGPNRNSMLWKIGTTTTDEDDASAEWPNEGRITCASAFTRDGGTLLVAERNGEHAELTARLVPSGVVIGEPLVMPSKFPLSISIDGSGLEVTTEAGTYSFALGPFRAMATTPLPYPHSARMGPRHIVAYSSAHDPVVGICTLATALPECETVWPSGPATANERRPADERADIEDLKSTDDGRLELNFHTARVRVICSTNTTGLWKCSTPQAFVEPANRGSRWTPVASDEWNVVLDGNMSGSTVHVERRGIWPHPYVSMRRSGRVFDAAILEGDVLRVLWWANDAIIVEDVPLGNAAFRTRALESVTGQVHHE